MSAETTNVKKQTKQHRPALWGMGIAVSAVAVLFLMFLFAVTDGEGDDVQQLISTEQAGS